MSYLIVRVEPKGNNTVKEADKEPPVADLHRRFQSDCYPFFADFEELAEKHGYELDLTIGPGADVRVRDWPFIAYCYVSPNKEGIGRAGSQLHRLVARRKEGA